MAFPWGALISLAGTALSGGLSAINNKRQSEADAEESARRTAHYEAQAAQDPTTTRAAQAALAQYDRAAKKQVETQRAMGVITGATPEQAIATQEAVAQGKADLLGNIAASGQERADKAKEKAEDARQMGYEAKKADSLARKQTYANLAANAASALGGIMDSYTAGKDGATPKKSGGVSTVSGVHSTDRPTALQAGAQQQGGLSDLERGVIGTVADAASAQRNAQNLATNGIKDEGDSGIKEGAPYRQKQPWEL